MYLLGYDVGSSSIKASIVDSDTGALLGSASSPDSELDIIVKRPGWAEQEPETWWTHIVLSTAALRKKTGLDFKLIKAIGISYQMHGLVLVDKDKKVLRPSIIWCDSRAIQTGEDGARKIGATQCLKTLLNLPGNFTASKLKWVKDNEPEVFSRIYKAMLPGDYIAMKLTDTINTTISGLSEGIFWDFEKGAVARSILDAYGIEQSLLPEIVPTFGLQGELTGKAASELGLSAGIKVTYRAGDQPNNALSLNVLLPGEVATTAGTSGVVYGVGDKPLFDPDSSVNTFVHVNHSKDRPRYGTLMCVNGCAITYRWLKSNMYAGVSYEKMDEDASRVNPGSDGLFIFPYGNGAERTLGNKNPGAAFSGINYNIHTKEHFVRAAQEGIVFAFNYGFGIMKKMGLRIDKVKAGYANLFLSPVFREAFVNTLGTELEVFDTDGSQGAARGAGIGEGVFRSPSDAFVGLKKMFGTSPDKKMSSLYPELYQKWRATLEESLNK